VQEVQEVQFLQVLVLALALPLAALVLSGLVELQLLRHSAQQVQVWG
jgi:hypothetical protein